MKVLAPVCAVLAYSLAIPAVVAAQTYETGGIQLSFGTVLGVEASDNVDFTAVGAKSRFAPYAGLSLGLLTQTPASSFAVDATGNLRRAAGDTDVGISAPRLSTRYERTSANATLDLSASVQRNDLSDDDVALIDETGLTSFVTGTGTRQSTTASGRLTFGRTTRVTYGIGLAYVDNSYTGGTATGLGGDVLDDNRRVTVDGTAALDLTTATQLTTRVAYSTFTSADPANDSDTLSLTGGVSIDRPLGPVTADLTVTDEDDGQQYGVSVGRSLNLPAGALTGRIGVTRAADDDLVLTGGIGAQRDLPTGSLNFNLSRQVSSSNEEDTSQVTTQVSLGYTRPLTSLTVFQLGADLAQAEDFATDAKSLTTALQASIGRDLTPDWAADVGYRYRSRDESPGDTTRSNSVFIELRRTFVTRF